MPITPRQQRRHAWMMLPLLGLMCVATTWTLWKSDQPQHKVLMAVGVVGFLVVVATSVWQLLHGYKLHETLANYIADPGRCGRCEYDLTGNVSGVCPECGWEIPRGQLDIDSPGWALWWRKWEIEHLRNWRATLRGVSFLVVFFAGCAIFTVMYLETLALAIFTALMALHMAMNAGRIAAYGRRASA